MHEQESPRGKSQPRYPQKRIASGALLLNEQGRVLLVKPTYKRGWEIPGGIVEADESPREACGRELIEELGLPLPIGRLLCIEYRRASATGGDNLQLIFDGGVLSAAQVEAIGIPNEELSEFAFLDVESVHDYLPPGLAGRLRAAVDARARGAVVYMEDGKAE